MGTVHNPLPKVEAFLSYPRSMSRVSSRRNQLKVACVGTSIFTRNVRRKGAGPFEPADSSYCF